MRPRRASTATQPSDHGDHGTSTDGANYRGPSILRRTNVDHPFERISIFCVTVSSSQRLGGELPRVMHAATRRARGARSSHNSSLRSTCTTIQGTRRDPKPVSTRPVLGRATPQHEAPDGACHCPSCDGVGRGRSDNNDSRALRGKPTERMRRHRSRVPPSTPTSSSYLAPSASALRPIFQTKLPL